MKWLEANGLSESVPRMEAHYLNPSPWAEKERYEIEFNDIQREVKGSAKRRSPGLVKFVPAIAYHFCLALPAAFMQAWDYLLAEPCTGPEINVCRT